MVESGKKQQSTLQRLARWPSSSISSLPSNKLPMNDKSLQSINHDDLKQGELYIVKIILVSIVLFEGWDDDMCCFSILRSDVSPMRWSEARYLPGDFYAYNAFDNAGNPSVHLWKRQLHAEVPSNWFAMFEEARRKQREWHGADAVQENAHPAESWKSKDSSLSKNYSKDSSEHITAASRRLHSYLDNHISLGYSLQSFSITDKGDMSAVASTNIVDPDNVSQRLGAFSSVSSLPLDSKPLGISDFFQNASLAPKSVDQFSRRSPSPTAPSNRRSSMLDPDELRKHLEHDLLAKSQEELPTSPPLSIARSQV